MKISNTLQRKKVICKKSVLLSSWNIVKLLVEGYAMFRLILLWLLSSALGDFFLGVCSVKLLPCRHPGITDPPIIQTVAKSQAKNKLQMFDWNKTLLWRTLTNEDTNSRFPQCPRLRELTVCTGVARPDLSQVSERCTMYESCWKPFLFFHKVFPESQWPVGSHSFNKHIKVSNCGLHHLFVWYSFCKILKSKRFCTAVLYHTIKPCAKLRFM